MKWPETKERFARLREAITLIRKLWTRGPRHASRANTTAPKTPRSTTSRRRRCRSMSPAPGPQVAKYAGRDGDGFICTSGKKWDLYTETLLPNVAEGLKLSSKPKPDYDRMIEMKVSFDTDHERALEDTRHWAALALTPEEKVSVEDPREMETPGRRAADRAGRQPLDRLHRSGRAYREDPALYRHGLPPSGVPRARSGPGAVPEALRRAGAAPAAAGVRVRAWPTTIGEVATLRVMAGLGPATHVFSCWQQQSRGWPAFAAGP